MNYDANPVHVLYDNESLKHLVQVIVERNDAISGNHLCRGLPLHL